MIVVRPFQDGVGANHHERGLDTEFQVGPWNRVCGGEGVLGQRVAVGVFGQANVGAGDLEVIEREAVLVFPADESAGAEVGLSLIHI